MPPNTTERQVWRYCGKEKALTIVGARVVRDDEGVGYGGRRTSRTGNSEALESEGERFMLISPQSSKICLPE